MWDNLRKRLLSSLIADLNHFFIRVEEYKVEDDNAQLASIAGNLLENNQDPKFANSKVRTRVFWFALKLFE